MHKQFLQISYIWSKNLDSQTLLLKSGSMCLAEIWRCLGIIAMGIINYWQGWSNDLYGVQSLSHWRQRKIIDSSKTWILVETCTWRKVSFELCQRQILYEQKVCTCKKCNFVPKSLIILFFCLLLIKLWCQYTKKLHLWFRHSCDLMINFSSCSHVISHVTQLSYIYDYIIRSCHEAHKYMTKAHGLIWKPCFIK